MKKKTKAMALVAICIVAIMVVSAFATVIAIPVVASELSNTESTEEIEYIKELQQWIYDQGYNYTVAENWVINLAIEHAEVLYGYKPPKAPKEPLPDNVGFVSDVPRAKEESEKLDHYLHLTTEWHLDM